MKSVGLPLMVMPSIVPLPAATVTSVVVSCIPVVVKAVDVVLRTAPL